MARRKRNTHSAINAWPGYVDALSTLLMVITFVLLVFVIGQQFLSATITQKERTLSSLKEQVDHLAKVLSLSQEEVKQLKSDNQLKNAELATLKENLDEKSKNLQELQEKSSSLEATQFRDILDLSKQVSALSQQLEMISKALDLEKQKESDKDQQIEDLGKKLNIALADKVTQLKRYRSEFFGRLREILKGKHGIEVKGDRFIFPSEILFPTGSAELTAEGKSEIRTLAKTFRSVASTIPKDIPWILRVDGHADRMPIHSIFPSNWELSSARAITVVKMLIAEGVDPHHLAATGFSVYQPLAKGTSAEDYARNRRIEFRLTDR
ncbi:peptidoglycan -binding protein [Aristophania vespae]|uniref:Peptidoglycan-binding protein n=1 Tax=Aristophania vespae TaxID=2697033 RepID=A0A6P1NE61_9PROT|nr:peptidoglycan -binding protein [Aristophania vespae]QHI95799.1 peptidoglycan -binding protein [Aristophania vespae]UMM63505.1 Outer membrane protein A [Aristophania vespae]